MATKAKATTKKRPVTEEITVARALELLNLHAKNKIKAKTVVATVVRDPKNTAQILHISLSEAGTAA